MFLISHILLMITSSSLLSFKENVIYNYGIIARQSNKNRLNVRILLICLGFVVKMFMNESNNRINPRHWWDVNKTRHAWGGKKSYNESVSCVSTELMKSWVLIHLNFKSHDFHCVIFSRYRVPLLCLTNIITLWFRWSSPYFHSNRCSNS